MGTLPSDRIWKYYGKKEPYFGVTGLDEHLVENIDDQSREVLFQTGFTDVENIFSTIYAKIDPEFKADTILDFGCGPGRMLIPFARYAKEVVGLDVSKHMIEEAQKNCTEHKISNVSFLLSDDDLTCLNDLKFNMVHSFIVLQHINRNRGEKVIKSLLQSIKINGVGVLQMTYCDPSRLRRIVNFLRYRIPYFYDLTNTLNRLFKKQKIKKLPLMQMNNYDLNKVLAILQGNNVTDLYLSFTNHFGYWGVSLFFKKK